MTLPAWPLRFPIRADFSPRSADRAQRTGFDFAPRSRRVVSDGPTVFTCSIDLIGADKAIFDAFILYDCNGGAGWFQVPLDAGYGPVLTEVRLADALPAPSTEGPVCWKQQMTLVTRVGTTIDAATYAVLKQYPGTTLFTADKAFDLHNNKNVPRAQSGGH